MAKILKVQIEDPKTGWSEWQMPIMSGYKMACCDCGLVHDLDFQVVVEIGRNGPMSQIKQIHMVNGKEARVAFRARRNTRSTAQHRRWKK